MKNLSVYETHQVSGGIGFTFFLSALSGATGGSLAKTITYDGLWWGFCFGIAGLPFYLVGAAVTAPIGFCLGAAEGLIGHAIGSIFYNPPQIIHVPVPAAPVTITTMPA